MTPNAASASVEGSGTVATRKPNVSKNLLRHESIETTMKFYVSHQADELSRDLWRHWDEQGAGRAEGDQTGDQNKDAAEKPGRPR